MKIRWIAVFVLGSFVLYGQEAKLVEFRVSPCKEKVDLHRMSSRIIDQIQASDTMKIVITAVANCYAEFKPSIRFTKDTLHLDYIGPNGTKPIDTICCYHFIYWVTGVRHKEIGIKFHAKIIERPHEDYRAFKVKYFIHNNDTTGYLDEKGRQGYIYSLHGNRILKEYFIDNKSIKYELFDIMGAIIEKGEGQYSQPLE